MGHLLGRASHSLLLAGLISLWAHSRWMATAMSVVAQQQPQQQSEPESEPRPTSLPLQLGQDVSTAADYIASEMLGFPRMAKRVKQILGNTETAACRQLIGRHLQNFTRALEGETDLPFGAGHWQLKGSCPEPFYDWDNLPPDIEHVGKIQNRTYQPPRRTSTTDTDTDTDTTQSLGVNETSESSAVYIDHADNLRLLYAILTHQDSESTIRLIETLHEPGITTFVVHVDGKPESDQAYQELMDYATGAAPAHGGRRRDYVHILPTRVRVNWGGFTMVQALLDMLHYSFNIKDYHSRQRDALPFHHLVHLSSTSYPIASRQAIRRKLAEFPLDANFVQVVMKPMRPPPAIWSYFVECDDRLHRLYRLPPLTNQTHGTELFTASQWFIISREFAYYLAEAKKGTFVASYLDYIRHVVVADETFVGTVVRNTKFCTKHHNRNYLHLQFDRWESDLPSGARDPRKCPMKDPNHCGRSPTIMTTDYADILELSDDLFARKFSNSGSSSSSGDNDDDDKEANDNTTYTDKASGGGSSSTVNVKDMVDGWVTMREERYQKAIQEAETAKTAADTIATAASINDHYTAQPQMRFEGHGALLVAKASIMNDDGTPIAAATSKKGKDTNATAIPLCLGLGPTGNNLRLVECFHRAVVPTLADNWYTGAVILEETLPHNRWDLDPCTSDGHMERLPNAEIRTTVGKYSQTGPRCMLKLLDGIRAGRCFDGDSGTSQPGGEVQVFPCMHRWVQFLSVGNGDAAPKGSLFYTIPAHIVAQIVQAGHKQIPYMCLGVWGRGVADEVEWDDPLATEPDDPEPETWPPLASFVNDELFSTQCTNKGAVIEWLFVPFINEDESNGVSDIASAGDSLASEL